jgi:GNAT superfamily N-acetyltransferase
MSVKPFSPLILLWIGLNTARSSPDCLTTYVIGPSASRGYWTLVQHDEGWGSGAPGMPGALVGRLAIHSQRQGEGLGSLILMDALHRSWWAAKTVASYAVRVGATDEKARDFYLRHDFLPFPNESLKLFFPMADLEFLQDPGL